MLMLNRFLFRFSGFPLGFPSIAAFIAARNSESFQMQATRPHPVIVNAVQGSGRLCFVDFDFWYVPPSFSVSMRTLPDLHLFKQNWAYKHKIII